MGARRWRSGRRRPGEGEGLNEDLGTWRRDAAVLAQSSPSARKAAGERERAPSREAGGDD